MKASMFITIGVGALGLVAGSAHAQPEISWSTIDGGGGISSGGSFELRGTIGQPDAARRAAGGTLTVTGGFWSGGSVAQPCTADLNDDGIIDLSDFFLFFANWDSDQLLADINLDYTLDLTDFFAFFDSYDVGC